MWLRQQSELVQLTKDKDMQSVDVRKLKKQLTILSQKKIRTEGKISLSLCLSLFIIIEYFMILHFMIATKL